MSPDKRKKRDVPVNWEFVPGRLAGKVVSLRIGQFSISPSDESVRQNGGGNVYIEKSDGEGGSFNAAGLEAAIKEFYDREF